MTWKEFVEGLTDDELILELKTSEDSIYRVNCFGTKDLIYLEWLYREIERRGLQGAVEWCKACGTERGDE